jgi:hypothetical protein
MARQLPSIFDQFPKGEPVTAEQLELAMEKDHEDRTLAALDRACSPESAGKKPAGEAAGDPAAFGNWDPDLHPRTDTGTFAPAEGAGAGADTHTPSGTSPPTPSH